MRISLTVALTLVALMAGTKSTIAAPAQMQHIKVDMHASGPNPNNVREFWLAGTGYARINQDQPHNAGIRLDIITPSDAWKINMGTKKGFHVLRDRENPVSIQLLQGSPEVTARFDGLVFGKELQYFEAQKTAKSSKKGPNGRALDEYTITDNQLGLSVILDIDTTSKKPVEMKVRGVGDKTEMTMEFLKYESIPFNDGLFKPPASIAMVTMSAAQMRAKKSEYEDKMASYRAKLLKEMASQKDNGTVR